MTDIKDIDYEIVWENNFGEKHGLGEIHFDNGWGASVRTQFYGGEDRSHDIAVIASRLNGIHFPKYTEEEEVTNEEANRILERIKNEPKCEL